MMDLSKLTRKKLDALTARYEARRAFLSDMLLKSKEKEQILHFSALLTPVYAALRTIRKERKRRMQFMDTVTQARNGVKESPQKEFMPLSYKSPE